MLRCCIYMPPFAATLLPLLIITRLPPLDAAICADAAALRAMHAATYFRR